MAKKKNKRRGKKERGASSSAEETPAAGVAAVDGGGKDAEPTTQEAAAADANSNPFLPPPSARFNTMSSKHSKKKDKKSADVKGGRVLVKESLDVVGGQGAPGVSCQYLVVPSTDENRPAEAKQRAQFTDEELFQPPPPKEECGICLLPQKDVTQVTYRECCGKSICCGCFMIGMGGARRPPPSCPFCRVPTPRSDREAIERLEKRCELDDAAAYHNLGSFYRTAQRGLVQDLDKAFQLLFRAAELGSAVAHLNIGYAYETGDGLELDVAKAVHHYEIAAVGGDLTARQNLGCMEVQAGNFERAQKHWAIAASAGDDYALDNVKKGFKLGQVTKDDFATILRAHQKSSDEMKSAHRDELGAPKPSKFHVCGEDSFEKKLQMRSVLRQNVASEPAAGTPTPCVELRNMIRDDIKDDAQYAALFEATQKNCAQFGSLLKVIIPRSGPGASKIFLEYETAEEAGRVIAALGGVGDRQHGKVEAVYCDPVCLDMHNWFLSIQPFATQDAISHNEGLWKGM